MHAYREFLAPGYSCIDVHGILVNRFELIWWLDRVQTRNRCEVRPLGEADGGVMMETVAAL